MLISELRTPGQGGPPTARHPSSGRSSTIARLISGILAVAVLGLPGRGLHAQAPGCALNPPSAQDDQLSVAADTPALLDVLANDVDLDGEALVIQSVQAAGVPGTVQVTAGQKLLFTPHSGFTGHATFEYTAADPSGSTDRATVDLFVGADEPPRAASDLFTSGLEEDGGPFVLSVLANDTDPDGGPLTILGVTGSPAGLTSHTATTVSFTPLADSFGSASFEYTVQDDEGDTDTAEVYLYVAPINDPPVARITASGCTERTCSFDASGSSDVEDGPLGLFAWNFGDGSPGGEGPVVTHEYAATGSYDVEVTVTDSAGVARSANAHALAAAFGSGCEDLLCTFDAGPVHDPAEITSYHWDFGDGTADAVSGEVAEHLYAAAGSYDVRLTLGDGHGNATTAERTVAVRDDDLAVLLLIILD